MTALPRLYAKGYSKTDGETPVTLWNLGNYRYEIEACWPCLFGVKGKFYSESEVFDSSYEDAMIKFEKVVDKVVLL